MIVPWVHTLSPFSPYFGLGQNSVTIKRVGHGWVRAYHFETRTIKVFLSLWGIPPMRIAVCFDGRITTRDHVPTFNLRALSPPPLYLIRFSLFLGLLIQRLKICYLHILFIIYLRPTLALSVFYTPTRISRVSSPSHSPSHPPTIPSTALRSEYPFRFQSNTPLRDEMAARADVKPPRFRAANTAFIISFGFQCGLVYK